MTIHPSGSNGTTMNAVAATFLALWLSTCLYALVRGGAPERVVSAALFAAALLTSFLQLLFWDGYRTVEAGPVLVDLALLALLVGVALRSARFWPMLMASMHGVGLLGHAAKALSPEILPAAYFALVSWWSFAMQALLGVGTWRHQGRLRTWGRDPAWAAELTEERAREPSLGSSASAGERRTASRPTAGDG